LDGHFSGKETGRGESDEPVIDIFTGLRGIGNQKPLTIVVDDLRLFGREPGFPKLDELVLAAAETFPSGHVLTGPDSLVVIA
jgi:hypothetical protein